MTIEDFRALCAERVDRGAKVLDGQDEGWFERVSADALEMSSTCKCVLGQRFGTYLTGLRELDRRLQIPCVEGTFALDHGFEIRPLELHGLDKYLSSLDAWNLLDELWLNEITKRVARVKEKSV